MESMQTRKRSFSVGTNGGSLTLCEQLVILLKTRREIRFLCNKVSLSLRACIVAELALCHAIELRQGKVVGRDQVLSTPLLMDAMNKIHQAKLTPGELMYKLNGERRSGNMHMRNVRARVYKSLEEKRICKVENRNVVFNKITVSNYNVRIEMINRIKEYLVGSGEVNYWAEVLVVCLVFCSAIDSILVCMTEKEAVSANAQIRRIRDKYREGEWDGNGPESIVFPLLKALLSS